MNEYFLKFSQVQKTLQNRGKDAVLVLNSDPHASEYLPAAYAICAALCGFRGSACTLIISQNDAWLLTDGRYFLQAEKQLKGSGVKLVKSPDFMKFLKENFAGKKILTDFAVCSQELFLRLNEFVCLENSDICAQIAALKPLEFHPIYLAKYRTQEASEKIALVKSALEPNGEQFSHLISSLDDIAYITNLRGSDIRHNPLFLSYLFLQPKGAILFCRTSLLEPSARDYLAAQNISVREYEEVFSLDFKLPCYVEFAKTSAKIAAKIPAKKDVLNPSTTLKSRKSAEEIANIKRAHLEDGAALVRFYMQLERVQNEASVDEILISERAKSVDYVGESFAAIAAVDESSALPHYRAPRQNSAALKPGSVFLLDSGALYQHGTTDITRVVIIPGASAPKGFVDDYTMVLKAHIAMAKLVHKEGVLMPYLDAIARAKIWEKGLDYIHGTGHGVGNFLNVHEGPQVLSIYAKASEKTAVYRGMLTSIEPGIYHAGRYGIRLENLYFSEHKISSQYGEFLEFVPATMYPFERELIDICQLNDEELEWLNTYHARVLESLREFLAPNEQKWLEGKCQIIKR